MGRTVSTPTTRQPTQTQDDQWCHQGGCQGMEQHQGVLHLHHHLPHLHPHWLQDLPSNPEPTEPTLLRRWWNGKIFLWFLFCIKISLTRDERGWRRVTHKPNQDHAVQLILVCVYDSCYITEIHQITSQPELKCCSLVIARYDKYYYIPWYYSWISTC